MKLKEPVNSNLLKLEKWLNYELSASVLLLLSWIWVILIAIVILALIALTPFLIKVLYQEKKNNWIIVFFAAVILPVVLISFIDVPFLTRIALLNIPLIIFFLYCFALKYAAAGWIADQKFINSSMEDLNFRR